MGKDLNAINDLINAPSSGRILSKDLDKYVKDCVNGDDPPCKDACPFDLDIISFYKKLQKGNFNSAYTVFRDQVLFPEIVCSLCPEPCAEACVRKDVDAPLAMKKMERAVIDFTRSTAPIKYNIPKKNQRIAIVGSGLCGLSCANKLFSHGYDVTIFEKSDKVGGILWETADPEMFVPEIEKQMQYIAYDFEPNREIKSLDELADFSAVLLATGADGNHFGLLADVNLESLGSQKEGVFLAGGLVGADLMSSIENGIRASQSIESYLKTKRMHEMIGVSKKRPSRFKLNAKRVSPMPEVQAERYTKEQAVEEAKRCLLCDCRECFVSCDLMQQYKKMPRVIVSEVKRTLNPVEGLQARLASRFLSSCNMCGLCGDVCPENIDMGEFLLEARRIMHREGSIPPVFHDFWLRDMAFTNGEDCYIAKNAPGSKKSEYVFFPGCQLGASDPRYVIKSYQYLLDKLPQTGLILGCCGAPAEWAGDELGMQANMDRLRNYWQEMGQPQFVIACPSCEKMLKKYLPEIEQVSFYEVMVQQGLPQEAIQEMSTVSVFDPCSSRYDAKMQKSIRQIVQETGMTIEELPIKGEEARCCGYGGHISPANTAYAKQITQRRAEMGEQPYITYCTNCRDSFAEEGKACRHILDVVFALNDDKRPSPSWSARRSNRIDLKRELLSELWKEEVEEMTDNCPLEIVPELTEKLNKQLIVEDDIKKVIEHCEANDSKIIDQKTGDFIGHLREGIITYWVVYRPEGDKYKVVNAYCHRMQIEGE